MFAIWRDSVKDITFFQSVYTFCFLKKQTNKPPPIPQTESLLFVIMYEIVVNPPRLPSIITWHPRPLNVFRSEHNPADATSSPPAMPAKPARTSMGIFDGLGAKLNPINWFSATPDGAGITVAVTGASGFMASELIAQLLQRGFTVRGTVRNTKDPAKVAHLTSLAGAAERLTLHEADMLNGPENFVPVFKGCTYVMHTACPFVFGNKAAELGEDFFVTPAVKGTLDVLEATRTAQGVRRVVLTSSMMAVIKKVADPQYVYDVGDWNDVDELRPRKAWCVPQTGCSFSSVFFFFPFLFFSSFFSLLFLEF